jgi:hypothetical protein
MQGEVPRLRRRLSSFGVRVAAPTVRLGEQTRAVRVKGDAGLVQVVERETGRAAATDTGAGRLSRDCSGDGGCIWP